MGKSAFWGMIDEKNLMYKMWEKVQLEDSFYENYEKFLEDEVWSYYD